MVVCCIVCLLWLWVIVGGTVVGCCFVAWYNVCLLLLHLLFICCFGWTLFGDLFVCVVWVGCLVLGLFAMGLGLRLVGTVWWLLRTLVIGLVWLWLLLWCVWVGGFWCLGLF